MMHIEDTAAAKAAEVPGLGSLNAGGIFKNTGRLVIWLTDDERRMPVLLKSKVTIGSISVVLVDMKPGA